jgi:uncharacterized protein (DUF1499 family)
MGHKRLSIIATLGFLIGIGALAGIFAAAYGYREGHWDYGFALLTITKYATYAGAGAAVLSLIGLGATLPGGNRFGLIISLIGLAAGGFTAGYIGNQYFIVRTVPFIHDISTDVLNPPRFQAAVKAREAYSAERGGEEMNDLTYTREVALQQQAGYPDIEPLIIAAPPAEVFEKAEALIEARAWEFLAQDEATGRIEATATSRAYRFKDDIVIRLTPTGSGTSVSTRVDMRSASRVGRSDVGVNATRIREFLAALQKSTS